MISQGIIPTIKDCVLPPVFFTLGVVPIFTRHPSPQIPCPQLLHYRSLSIYPKSAISTSLKDLDSIPSSTLPPFYFMSRCDPLSPENSLPLVFWHQLGCLSRLHHAASLTFHNQIWWCHFSIQILPDVVPPLASSQTFHHIFASVCISPDALHHISYFHT